MKITTEQTEAYTNHGHRWLDCTLTFDDGLEVPCTLMGYSLHSSLYDSTEVNTLFLRIDDKRSDSCLTINGVDIIVDGLPLKVYRTNRDYLIGKLSITWEDFNFNFRRLDGGWDRKSLSNSAMDKLKDMFGFGLSSKSIELPLAVISALHTEVSIRDLVERTLDEKLTTCLDQLKSTMTQGDGLLLNRFRIGGGAGEEPKFDYDKVEATIRSAIKEMKA